MLDGIINGILDACSIATIMGDTVVHNGIISGSAYQKALGIFAQVITHNLVFRT
jgi:hypothetical protein